MSWMIKAKGLWACCSSFMKGGVPVLLRFTLTWGLQDWELIFIFFIFINAVLILCSHLCKSIITTRGFFIYELET